MSDTPADVARRLADVLEAAHLPYAIGGAIAYAYWGTPRATKDVDLNIFVGADQIPAALAALRAARTSFDEQAVLEALACGDDARLRAGDVVVDVFFNSIPLHLEAARRTVLRPLKGRPARILSAEDLTVLKLLFFRGKDIVDVEILVAVQGSALDRAYVRRWLVDLVGESDARVVKWDEICAALPAN
jgi:hypothetical protein